MLMFPFLDERDGSVEPESSQANSNSAENEEDQPIPGPSGQQSHKPDGKRSGSPIERNSQKRIRSDNASLETGTHIFEDTFALFSAKKAALKRNMRFGVDDHLYNLEVNARRRTPPLLSNILSGLKIALIKVLENLKRLYDKSKHHQIYVTVIENKILNGLNSGSYDINTPSLVIANRVLSMLYNFLKSFQTLCLNPSFKVQMKVLSVNHINHLRRSPRKRNRIHYFPNIQN